MSFTVDGNFPEVDDALGRVKETIRESKDIPDGKKRRLLALWDGPPNGVQWTIQVAPPGAGEVLGLDGATNAATKTILVSRPIAAPQLFDENARKRLRAVLFHELVHATGEGELDCEVLENIVFKNKGATPPGPEDTGTVVGGKLSSGGHGFSPPTPTLPPGAAGPAGPPPDPWAEVVGDHYIWDPRTGRVWKKGPNGTKIEPPVFSGGRWKRLEATRLTDGNYRIGSAQFDPVRLQLFASASGNRRVDHPASPHFRVGLFLSINEYEAGMLHDRAPARAQRMPLPLLQGASFRQTVRLAARKRRAPATKPMRKRGKRPSA
jgi:hypothetical protein